MEKQILFKTVVSLPVVVATCAFLFLLFSPSSIMVLWRPRKFASNIVAVCALLHFVALIGLFLRRKFKMGGVAMVCLPLLLFAAFLGSMLAGPDVASIESKVSLAVSVPAEKFKCLGGMLSRESFVFLACSQEIDISACNASVIGNEDPTYGIVGDMSSRFGCPLQRPYGVWRVKLDFDTLLIANDGIKQLVVFAGMANL